MSIRTGRVRKVSEQINEKTEAFYKEVHAELKKVMDNKYYREFQSSNGGQALDNVINHFGQRRGWRVDKTVKSIIDKYGRNRDEFVTLSFRAAAAARRGMREEYAVIVSMKDDSIEKELEKKFRKDFLGSGGSVDGGRDISFTVDTHDDAKKIEKFVKQRKYKKVVTDVDIFRESVEMDEAKSPVKSLGKEAKAVLAMALNMSAKGGGAVAHDNNLEYFTPDAIDAAIKFLDKNSKQLTPAGRHAAREIVKKLGESVELDEYRRQDVYVIVDKKGKVVASKLTKKNAHKEISRHRDGTIVLDPDAKTGDILKTFAKESVELDEADNTAAVAKQVKQAVKKYVTGTPRVQSKGVKVRFIMLRADKIDNKLRKIILDIEHPNAKVKNMDDIHYANISDRIISAGADVWIDALGLKEGSLGYKKALRSRKKNPDKEKKMDLRRWSAEKKKRNKKIHSDVQSEDIANVAGSGAVAGLGDEPPVSKAAQKKKQRSGGATGGIPTPKKGDLIPPTLGESTCETFAGCRVFEVEDEEYGKALYGRQKYERWNKKFDMNKETNQMIQTYANRNPGKGIVIKNKKTGDMSYLMNRNY